VGLVILLGISFEIYNIIEHATHHTTTTEVHANVSSVRALGDDKVVISATIQSLETAPVQVACLVGIVEPGEPLAYPIRVTEQLSPGETKSVEITRTLLKPLARGVALNNVAFTCT